VPSVFLGHYGVALAAKRAVPRAPLGTLVAAATLLDLIWPLLLLSGIERVRIAPGDTAFTPLEFVSYPISHSLVTAIGWALLFGVIYEVRRGDRAGAIAVALLVASHWFLDAVVHRPDLPLAPGVETRVGLGLWNQPLATMFVETAIFAVGLRLYVGSTEAKDRWGSIALWSFAAVMLFILALLAEADPPPSVRAVALVGISGFLPVAWAWWIDRHRRRSPSPNAPAEASPRPGEDKARDRARG
jgi:hypothetical protein